MVTASTHKALQFFLNICVTAALEPADIHQNICFRSTLCKSVDGFKNLCLRSVIAIWIADWSINAYIRSCQIFLCKGNPCASDSNSLEMVFLCQLQMCTHLFLCCILLQQGRVQIPCEFKISSHWLFPPLNDCSNYFQCYTTCKTISFGKLIFCLSFCQQTRLGAELQPAGCPCRRSAV